VLQVLDHILEAQQRTATALLENLQVLRILTQSQPYGFVDEIRDPSAPSPPPSLHRGLLALKSRLHTPTFQGIVRPMIQRARELALLDDIEPLA
jgi:hypothetical protein